MNESKPFTIPKALVYEAWKLVKANAGSAGIDRETIEEFAMNANKNLYRLWNRMSSGTYFPPPVKAVAIPKKTGGERILGIPTVTDRIAQMVAKLILEPILEPLFLPDSYGYRPGKSALDAIAITRKRCWQYDWVLEFDIRGLFDNIDHTLLLKAVDAHIEVAWVKLYIRRWLVSPLQNADGALTARTKGVPQGGVISPVLSNLFMHYAFDVWMNRKHARVPWCRYADDGLTHCKTEQEAQEMRSELAARFAECGLEMHPEKTQIVYCKDGRRRDTYANTKFDFLGYGFRRREVKAHGKNPYMGFNPGASDASLKSMRAKTRALDIRNRSDMSLQDIARIMNPILRGWIHYYGRFYQSRLYPVLRHFNMTVVQWAMRKYRRLKRRQACAVRFLSRVAAENPSLFVHWQMGIRGLFA